jgi:hypothetical protein
MDSRAIIGFLIDEFSKCFDNERSREKQNELKDLSGLLLEKKHRED